MDYIKYPERKTWDQIARRPDFDNESILSIVTEIVDDVCNRGDESLLHFTEKLDGWVHSDLLVAEEDIQNAEDNVSDELKDAILTAKSNIEKFHAAQREPFQKIETMPGIQCWRKSIAIERVGLYIPGGSAPLFSTLLMLGIPARIAGCRDIVVCSPAKNGFVHPALLYVASLLGIRQFYKVGGAQAIAAMAYGTNRIGRVDKIFGPGNRYVTLAKRLVNSRGVAIDMPAGPSEVAVFADQSAVPSFVAADLLSQAEHGRDSQVILTTVDEGFYEKVESEINRQLESLDRTLEIQTSLKNSRCVLFKDVDESFDFLNIYAPEHLIIASDNADRLSEKVINAGSVFLGHFSPESAGDYISGTNHTLPTNRFAKAYSGVSVDSFVKKITFQKLSPEGLQSVTGKISQMALAEGLKAHSNAASVRFNINKMNER